MKNNKSPVIENRKVRHEYFIEDTIECGIVLKGNEVKSIRDGKVSIKEAWVTIENGQLIVKQMHITPWSTANMFDVDSKREVKLLAHSREISKMFNKIKLDGYTLVPLKIYFSDRNKCKMLLGICKGKKNYDKRASDKEKDAMREMRRYKV